MTELERAELREVLDEAIRHWWFPIWKQANLEGAEVLAVDSAVMAERETCALLAEEMGALEVAKAIREQ